MRIKIIIMLVILSGYTWSMSSQEMGEKDVSQIVEKAKKQVATLSKADEKAAVEGEYKPHGWAKCQIIRNETDSQVNLFFKPTDIRTEFPEGSVVAIKSLKTGFGNYYRVKKDERGVWRLYVDAKNTQDPATHFFVMHVGSDAIAFSSEVANDFFLESDPKTFEVILKSDKQSGNSAWTFVPDEKAGPTAQSCYLKNKVTNGFLTSAYEGEQDTQDNEIASLKTEIERLEREIPYLKITFARTGGVANKVNTAGSVDIAAKLQERVRGNNLEVSGKDWVTDISGKSKATCGWTLGRVVEVRYLEGSDPNEKKIHDFFEKGSGSKIKDSDRPLIIDADVNKHPATALQKRLAELMGKAKGRQLLKTSELASTGFQGAPFDKVNQWSKVAVQTISSFAQDEDEKALNQAVVIAPQSPYQPKADLWVHQSPEFKGFGTVKIPDFNEDKMGFFGALYSQGVAWFDSMLPIPGQGTIFFRAKADQGDVHVCFGEELGTKVYYRVAFGTEVNSKIAIYKNDQKVNEVVKELNPLARIVPGEIEKFWVSINDGFILVGKGDPGDNVVMGWQDPLPSPKILYMGLSTFKTRVIVVDVQRYPDPIVFFPPEKVYVEDKQAISVGAKDSPAWQKFPLSPPSAGTIVFKGKGKDLSLALAEQDDDKAGYKISWGNGFVRLSDLEDDEELCKVAAQKGSLAELSSDKLKLFWISFYKGFFVVGSGEIGKNTFLAYYDFDYSQKLSRLGFSGDASVQDLQIWPEIEFGFPKTTSEYAQKRVFSAVKGNLVVLSPFNYRIVQQGPQVAFKDKLTGDQWNVVGTPEPNTTYLFSLQVKSTGEPDFKFVSKDVSPIKKTLTVGVELAEKSSEIAFKRAMMLAQGTTELFIPSMIATAAAAGMSAVDVALSTAAALGKGVLAEIETAASREVKVDRPSTKPSATAEVDPQAQKNRDEVVRMLGEVSILDLTDKDKMESITKLWSEILRRVTGFYVVQDTSVKQKIINGMTDLYKTVIGSSLDKESLSIYLRLLDILIKAHRNPYLIKAGELLEENQKKNWYVWINELFKKLYVSPLIGKTGLSVSFGGEYFWIPQALSKPGRGSVVFQAKTYKDIFVGFCESPFEVSAKSTRMYEIVFGINAMSIRRKNMGDSVIEFDYKKYPELAPDPMSFKKYWINLDNGVLSGGVGELGQNKLWEWKDPYLSASLFKWVGFSTGLGEVSYKDIKVGNAIS
jgi:hypothetical protein